MTSGEFYTPGPEDVAALRLEKELLAYENQYLAARVAEMERETERLQVMETQVEVYRTAYHDLRWLLRRLSSSPVGPLLNRWRGWRELHRRHPQ